LEPLAGIHGFTTKKGSQAPHPVKNHSQNHPVTGIATPLGIATWVAWGYCLFLLLVVG